MDALTAAQVRDLRLNPAAPLLICDVDEVVVQFVSTLQAWLEAQSLALHCDSWQLEGNIRTADGRPLRGVAFERLLMRFFDECTATMPLLEGAAEALAGLARNGVQIVMLTNLPHAYREAREGSLRRQGLAFPLVSNSGPKGPAVRAIRRQCRAQAAFIDDHPDFLHSAWRHLSPREIHLVHFVNDTPFVAHLPPLNAPHVRVHGWREAEKALRRLLLRPAHRHAAGS